MRTLLAVLLLLQAASPATRPQISRPASAGAGALVLVGGGGTTDEIIATTLRLAGGPEARMLIVPNASASENAGESSATFWREHGAKNVEILNLTDPDAARAAIARADFIWMPGGVQSRLVDALRSAGLIDDIRSRHAAGAVVGGTSAGCAAATEIMITSDGQGPPYLRGGSTPTADGLGLWKDAIVDQHFVKRGRLERLITAVLDRPSLLGVGVDEKTAVIVRGDEFEVVGAGQVVVVDARRTKPSSAKDAPQSARDIRLHVLNTGERFRLRQDQRE